MSKVLTPELFEKYKEIKSTKGFTFSNAIQCGVLKPHLGVGFTAGDEEVKRRMRKIERTRERERERERERAKERESANERERERTRERIKCGVLSHIWELALLLLTRRYAG